MAASQPYHHGDLRTALLDAAEAALRADPKRDLSLRRLAAELGVSATAPQAHFRTKADLLAALATRGFERLAAANRAALAAPALTGQERLAHLAQSYLQFSGEHEGLYRLMFSTGIDADADAALYAASRRSFAVLDEAIALALPGLGQHLQPERVLIAWALAHGLALLLSDGRIPAELPVERDVENLAAKIAERVLA